MTMATGALHVIVHLEYTCVYTVLLASCVGHTAVWLNTLVYAVLLASCVGHTAVWLNTLVCMQCYSPPVLDTLQCG